MMQKDSEYKVSFFCVRKNLEQNRRNFKKIAEKEEIYFVDEDFMLTA